MDIALHYKINFNLNRYHKYSIEDLENMYPWERDITISMVQIEKKKEEERAKNG